MPTDFNTVLLGFVVGVQTLGMLYALHATKNNVSFGKVVGVTALLLMFYTLSLFVLRKTPMKDKSGNPIDVFASLLAGTAISVFIVSPLLILFGTILSWSRHPGFTAVAIPVLATGAFYGSLYVAKWISDKDKK